MGRHLTRRQERPRPTPPPRRKGPWKNGPVPVVGLIGGIGAGKTQVAAILAKLGAHVIDADAVGHALLNQAPAREAVVERFGEELLDHPPGGSATIDRKRLGMIVFNEPGSLAALEAILHPRMRQTFEKAISRANRKRMVKAVVLDAAVLFEAKWNDLCDLVLFVDAPAETRLARVQQARGWTAETLATREKAQSPLDEKRGKCDFVIENLGSLDALETAVVPIWERFVRSRPGVGYTAPPKRPKKPAARPTDSDPPAIEPDPVDRGD